MVILLFPSALVPECLHTLFEGNLGMGLGGDERAKAASLVVGWHMLKLELRLWNDLLVGNVGAGLHGSLHTC